MYVLSACVVPLRSSGALTSSQQCRPLLPRKGGGTKGEQRVGESFPHPVLPADEGTLHVQKKTPNSYLYPKEELFFIYFILLFFSAGICSDSTESLDGTESWESRLGIMETTGLYGR